MRKRGVVIILILILSSLVGVGVYLVNKKYLPTSRTVDLKLVLPGKEASANEAYILRNDTYIDNMKAVIKDGDAYIPLELASDIDSKYYLQKGSNKLFFTDSKSTMKLTENSKDVVNGDKTETLDYFPFIKSNDKPYVSIKFIAERSKAVVTTAENPNRVIIRDKIGTKTAMISRGEALRSQAGIKNPQVYKPSNEKVYIIKEYQDWTKVTNEQGYIGYVRTKYLSDFATFNGREDYKGKYDYFTLDKKIILGWHQVTNTAANESVGDLTGVKSGVNVISPTWYSVNDNNGNIKSIASVDYVEKMHSKNIAVWVLVDDFAQHVSMAEVLSNEASRSNLIRTLVSNTKSVGADGINIDFEKITKETSASFLQFLRELYLATRSEKLVVSVDNYVPKAYNKFYSRDEQSEVADYIIIMGYDEHAGNSKTAGSVASIDFVRSGIEQTLLEVPANKVINAVPFYTRIWDETPLTEETAPNATEEERALGSKVGNISLSMKEQDKIIEDRGMKPKWIEKDGQNYGEAIKAGIKYKLWIEDARSLEMKLKLIKENNLAGVAGWKLGLETDDVWPLINKYMN